MRVIDGAFANFSGTVKRSNQKSKSSRSRCANVGRATPSRAEFSQVEKRSVKKITGYIELQLPAGKANPSPPVGPALGSARVNIMRLCQGVQRQERLAGRHDRPGGNHGLRQAASFSLVMKTAAGSYFSRRRPPARHHQEAGQRREKSRRQGQGEVTTTQLREL